MRGIVSFLRSMLGSLRDLAPIVLVIAFFEIIVLHEQPPNLLDILIGLVAIVLGLTFFIRGLDMGLFPLGESMAYDFARKGSLGWLLSFAFALGFGTTVAEPALIAVADEAAAAAADGGVIAQDEEAMADYALGLRLTESPALPSACLLSTSPLPVVPANTRRLAVSSNHVSACDTEGEGTSILHHSSACSDSARLSAFSVICLRRSLASSRPSRISWCSPSIASFLM